MMKKAMCAAIVLAVIFTSSAALAAERASSYDAAAFSVSDIYQTGEEYEAAREFWGLKERFHALDGRLDKPENLLGAFLLIEEGGRTFEKLYAYAYLAYAADQLDAAAQERYRSLKNAAARFEAQIGELIGQMAGLSPGYLKTCRADKRFAAYSRMLSALASDALDRNAGQKRAEEAALRELAPALAFPAELAVIVLNADLNPASVTRPDGVSVPATAAEMARAMSGGDARYRREAYEKYYEALGKHRNTLAASLEAYASGRAKQAAMRGGGESCESQIMLGRYEMPPDAADTLVNAVTDALPLYHRGAELKARAAGKSVIRPYDVAVPACAGAGRYTFGQAAALVLDALEPLGEEYLEHARRILYGGHVNHEPGEGKLSGAFCMSAGPDCDPYIHINFDGSLNAVSTLAHELGHAVHMAMASKAQSGGAARPALAPTETAAILNEILLMRRLLETAVGKDDTACAANAYADLIGSTLFQQARYFIFERSVYALVEEGGVLTADKGDQLWEDAGAPFRGASLEAPEAARSAWAGVPHLYRDFYVVNYAFSMAAAETFADALAGGKAGTVTDFLKAGGSIPAYKLFCAMGVDLLEQSAYNDVVARLGKLYDTVGGLDVTARAA